MEADIVLLIEEQFAALRIELDGAQLGDLSGPGQLLPVEIRRGSEGGTYWLTYQPEMTFTAATQLARGQEDRPLLVLGERISERSATAFRDAGIQYLDVAGNAYLSFGTVLVDIRGRRPRVSRSKLGGSGRGVNLFSPRRARVVFAFVTWPDLVNASVRKVASTAGVSPGLAHETLELLQNNGYLSGDHTRELRNGAALLDHWAASYPSGLAPTLKLAEFAGDIEGVRPVNPDQPIFISGESAVPDVLRPTSLTIYVEELDPKLPIVNRWRSDGPPNIMVRRKFWQDPLGRDEQSEGPLKVPWTLVYADLMATGESRQRAAARELRDGRAALGAD